jgi:hypothetical protein
MIAIPTPKNIQPYLPSPSIALSAVIEPRFSIGEVITRAEFERNEWLDK